MNHNPLDPTSIFRHLPAALRKLRKDRGLNLEGLARRSGISRATLSRYEVGQGSPTIINLMTINRALGVRDVVLFRTLAELSGESEVVESLPMSSEPTDLPPEDRLLAVWARHVENGKGDLWLAQTEAQIARVKAVRDHMRKLPEADESSKDADDRDEDDREAAPEES